MTEKSVSGSSAWSRLYSELLSSLRVTLDGEEVSTETALSRLFRPEREIRQEAAAAVGTALVPGLRTRAYVYNTILLDKSIDDRLRGYPSWISSRNLVERGERRGSAGAGRRRRLAIRRRTALLPPQGAAAGPRTHRALRPLRPGRRARRDARAGRTHGASSSRRTPTSTRRSGRSSTASSRGAGSMLRCARTSRTAPSARRPSRVCIRTCS